MAFRIASNELEREIGWISRGVRVSRCGTSTRCWNVKRFRTHLDSGGVPVAAFEAASSFFSRPEAAQTAPANNLWRLPLVNCTHPPERTYCMMYDAVRFDPLNLRFHFSFDTIIKNVVGDVGKQRENRNFPTFWKIKILLVRLIDAFIYRCFCDLKIVATFGTNSK